MYRSVFCFRIFEDFFFCRRVRGTNIFPGVVSNAIDVSNKNASGEKKNYDLRLRDPDDAEQLK